jgi:hypothetical protein
MISDDELQAAMDDVESGGPTLAPVEVLLALALQQPLEETRELLEGNDRARARTEQLKNMQKVKICELLASAKIKCSEAELLMRMLFGEKGENSMELQNFFDDMNNGSKDGED